MLNITYSYIDASVSFWPFLQRGSKMSFIHPHIYIYIYIYIARLREKERERESEREDFKPEQSQEIDLLSRVEIKSKILVFH